ncbi:MAG: toprim domain-containing protein, partial [Bacteroidetes bacterium]|nr:toprim domain-containing protein [Bacteroidota bacterium]
GMIVTLYGRSISEGNKRHLFLPDRPTGLWNSVTCRTFEVVILVESIIDGFSVLQAGFPNVVAIQGTNGLGTADIDYFKECGIKELTLLLDGDESGKKAVKQLKEKLSPFSLRPLELPDGHDPNSYLQEYGTEKLAEFIRFAPSVEDIEEAENIKDCQETVSQQKPVPEPSSSSLTANSGIQATADGFMVSYGLRCYKVIGVDKGRRKLKATVRLEHGGKFHVDTIDFYSARARRVLAQDICRIFNEMPENIDTDITRLIDACEQAPEPVAGESCPETTVVEISAKDKKEAETFGKSPDLISNILTDFETCGLIGEESNKLLGYLVMSSRKLDKPLSMLILSSSGAGKSVLQDGITAFCPTEDLVKITSLSGKALFYKDQGSLKNKVLAIEEGDGADDAAYAIRSLISNGVLISESTIKDLGTGRLTTMENRVEGPTSVFFTTTNPDTDPETASRFFVTGIDESREQTRRILEFQRKEQMKGKGGNQEVEAVRKRHRNFQRLLKPLGVRNPFGDQLAYADDRLQGRRDQPKYLQLIKAVAFLRQLQKEIKGQDENSYVEVDLEDIQAANVLTNEVLGRSLDELSRPGSDLLMQLDEMVEQMAGDLTGSGEDYEPTKTEMSFSRREVREYTGWSNYRVHTHMKELVNLEYVLVDSGRNGISYRYRLAYEGQGKSGEKFMLGLKSMEDLQEA